MQSQRIRTKRIQAHVLFGLLIERLAFAFKKQLSSTRTLSWFGHGCSGHRMLFEHERYHGLGMDALVTVCSCKNECYHGLGMDALVIVCSWSTDVIMVWARMLWSSYALGARTLFWFGHGCSGHRMLLEHERYHGLGTDALLTVYALGTRTLSWVGHGCSGHRMLLEHERYHGLGMDALVTVCSWSTNVVMGWAWMLWSSYALGTRTLSWVGHGCSGHRMLLEHERYHGLGTDALLTVYALGTRTLSWVGHGCSGHRMLLEHERYHGLGMDALVTVFSWNTNVITVWARMLWSSYALGARTLSWFGHGCSVHRMLSEHERFCGHGMVWPWTKSKYVYCLNQSTSHRTPK